jgi:PAS domain S-box-containing protein
VVLRADLDFDRLLDSRSCGRDILAAVPGTAVVVFDRDLCVRAAEGDELDRLGFGASAIAGRLLAEVLPASAWSELKGPCEGALAGHARVFDFRSEGVVYSILVSPLQSAGEIFGGVAISHTITEQRRLEAIVDAEAVAESELALRTGAQALRESDERWSMLLAHMQEIVIVVDTDGVVTYTSPSVEHWLGYKAEELLGRGLAVISQPADAAVLELAVRRAGPGECISVSHRLRAKDGCVRSLESTLVCLNESPLLGAVLITGRDVTDRVALGQDRERLELDRRVSQRLEAVGQLSAGIAHEINTPLQFVGDSVTFLKQAVDELIGLSALYRETLHADAPVPLEERRSIMRKAEKDADVDYLCERIPVAFARTAEGIARVRSIVEAMKRFSHAGSEDVSPADINDAIETTLVVCRNEYKYVAEVTVDLADLPLVACHIGELNQVFLNLIINAAQAIAENPAATGRLGQIRLVTRLDGPEVIIEISDDGPGIAPELQDRIYEPFFTTKEVGKGTGQGLALARTTIDRHSGSLTCVSVLGQGTTFTIRLPLDAPTADTGEDRVAMPSDARSMTDVPLPVFATERRE